MPWMNKHSIKFNRADLNCLLWSRIELLVNVWKHSFISYILLYFVIKYWEYWNSMYPENIYDVFWLHKSAFVTTTQVIHFKFSALSIIFITVLIFTQIERVRRWQSALTAAAVVNLHKTHTCTESYNTRHPHIEFAHVAMFVLLLAHHRHCNGVDTVTPLVHYLVHNKRVFYAARGASAAFRLSCE